MIKTEFSKVNDLYLAYPKGFSDTSDNLISFYKKLIEIIPENIRQFIIVNNEEAGKEIKELFPRKNIEIILIENFNEIWLRDIMGFKTSNNKICRPIYNPDYCNHIYTLDYLIAIDNQVKQIFHRSIKAEVIEIPLIFDGGNLVTNGKIGFIIDKIIKDNQNISQHINKIIKEYLGIETIIMPSNKYDKLAHADGYLNFLNEKTICLPQYPQIEFLKTDIEYINQLKNIAINNQLEITTLYDRPVAEKVIGSGKTQNDKSSNCLNSARGIYVNFLLLNNTIILPEYTLPNYKKNIDYNTVNKKTLTDLGYNVISINCDELAYLGGSLHCISFTN